MVVGGNFTYGTSNNNLEFQGSGSVVVSGNFTGGNNQPSCTGGASPDNCDVQFAIGGSCAPAGAFCSTIVPNNPLPISLFAFYSKQEIGKIALIWQASADKDELFIIEKSTNGYNFQEISKMWAM